jgi:hypothetical protein
MSRLAVIGDVGGHADQLRWALDWLGAESGRLPPDVVVIQVGDLVDRGPDSMGVLETVTRLLAEQPRQWIQLVGNHELQYLPGGTVFWREPLADAGVRRLRDWWAAGSVRVAAAVRTADGDPRRLAAVGRAHVGDPGRGVAQPAPGPDLADRRPRPRRPGRSTVGGVGRGTARTVDGLSRHRAFRPDPRALDGRPFRRPALALHGQGPPARHGRLARPPRARTPRRPRVHRRRPRPRPSRRHQVATPDTRRRRPLLRDTHRTLASPGVGHVLDGDLERVPDLVAESQQQDPQIPLVLLRSAQLTVAERVVVELE